MAHLSKEDPGPVQIVKVRFRVPHDFSENYLPDGPAGTLFCPTTTPLEPGEEVVVELAAAELPNKVLMRGEVKWWRPALPRLRVRAGAQVEFLESEQAKRDFLLECMERGADADGDGTNRAEVRKRRHARLPVEIQVRYRTGGSADYHESGISEISAGGALLRTPDGPLPIDSEIILELRVPGGVGEVELTGRVTYHAGQDGTGIKFVYRDGGGSRRLRELIRRLRKTS